MSRAVTQSLAAAWADYDNDGFLDLLVEGLKMDIVRCSRTGTSLKKFVGLHLKNPSSRRRAEG